MRVLPPDNTDAAVQVRVFQNNRCALSGSPLELPAVHFLCGHSFNARSLGENERECPLCAPQFRTILEIRRSLRAGAAEQVLCCETLRGFEYSGMLGIAVFFLCMAKPVAQTPSGCCCPSKLFGLSWKGRPYVHRLFLKCSSDVGKDQLFLGWPCS